MDLEQRARADVVVGECKILMVLQKVAVMVARSTTTDRLGAVVTPERGAQIYHWIHSRSAPAVDRDLALPVPLCRQHATATLVSTITLPRIRFANCRRQRGAQRPRSTS